MNTLKGSVWLLLQFKWFSFILVLVLVLCSHLLSFFPLFCCDHSTFRFIYYSTSKIFFLLISFSVSFFLSMVFFFILLFSVSKKKNLILTFCTINMKMHFYVLFVDIFDFLFKVYFFLLSNLICMLEVSLIIFNVSKFLIHIENACRTSTNRKFIIPPNNWLFICYAH